MHCMRFGCDGPLAGAAPWNCLQDSERQDLWSEGFGVLHDHHTTVMTCYQLVAVCAALTKAFK